ncbi:MAG: hypothetical protein ABI563_02385 [Specibacter sp.]
MLLLHHGRVVAEGTPSEVLTTENIESVYRIGVSHVDLDDGFKLIFRPLSGRLPLTV